MLEWIRKLLEHFADIPFGAASVWKAIARKPITKAQAFELNLVGFLVLVYTAELVIVGLAAKGDILQIAPQHFIVVVLVIVASLFITTLRKS